MKPHFLDRLPGAQRGQSMVEYAIVCTVFAVALFAPVPGSQMSAAQMLADALRKSYKALSFFLSLP
jgi:Flp pilus assembly protein TadG